MSELFFNDGDWWVITSLESEENEMKNGLLTLTNIDLDQGKLRFDQIVTDFKKLIDKKSGCHVF